ncbi:hypothetical protein RF11_09918 [Thelohanellus kitauei]|uniref:Uncharacterized protein n=1 Tax=Thelohanellus kitauei TaxID=669202 RepID=A0A0C2NCN3_THEKT|nr:hypothetical protein RF11_09918 [Thelohanellus kitauei]
MKDLAYHSHSKTSNIRSDLLTFLKEHLLHSCGNYLSFSAILETLRPSKERLFTIRSWNKKTPKKTKGCLLSYQGFYATAQGTAKKHGDNERKVLLKDTPRLKQPQKIQRS